MYRKPTKEEVNHAVECGWDIESATRGYTIFAYEDTGILAVFRIDEVYMNGDVMDDDCAIEAERSGVCHLIPVDELPRDCGRKYCGWVDTPLNRELIAAYGANLI